MSRIFEKKFLIAELAILLLFFIITAVICIHLFFKADKIASDADILDHAVTESTSIAETLKSSDGDLSRAAELLRNYKSYQLEDNILSFYYDDAFNPAYGSNACYRARITMENLEDCFKYDIVVTDINDGNAEDGEIYRLSFKALKKGGGI